MIDDDKHSAGSGSYVLDAMDADEREEFELMLAESEDLRNEVIELTDTAVLLGLAMPPVMPPPALKARIMAQLGDVPQSEPEQDAVQESRELAPVVTLHAVPGGRASTRARTRWYSRPATIVTAAAAAIIVIVGVLFGANLVSQGANSSRQATALAAISSASDVRRAEAAVSTGGTATLVWSNKLGRSALIGKGLKALPSGKTYELWYIDAAGRATDAGLFESAGKSTLAVLSGRMARGDTVGVTVEPAGGSTSPTTKPIVAIASA